MGRCAGTEAAETGLRPGRSAVTPLPRIGVALDSSAVLLSPIDFRCRLDLCVGLTLLYLLPPPHPRYADDPQSRDADLPGNTTQGGAAAMERKT